MAKKLTLEEVKQFIEENSDCELLSTKYINKNTKMVFRCGCGNIFETTFDSFKHKNKRQCNKCGRKSISRKQRLNIDDVKQEFINNGYIPLFQKYKNCETKLTAMTKEGYKVYTTFRDFKQNKNPKVFLKSNPYTIENIKLWLKLNGSQYKLISTKYKSACNDKLEWLCPRHGVFYATWNSIQSGRGCYLCRNEKIGNIKRLTLAEVENRLKSINPSIDILSKEYIDNNTPLKCKCLICGHEWYAKYANLSQGTGCIKCFIKHQRGENHPNWQGGISTLNDFLRHCIDPWKRDTLKKYNYRCDITGSEYDLVIHHLYNFSDILYETLEKTNLPVCSEINEYTKDELEILKSTCLQLHYKYGLGVCLTEDKHNKFHELYGKENNNEYQYKEFKNNMI